MTEWIAGKPSQELFAGVLRWAEIIYFCPDPFIERSLPIAVILTEHRLRTLIVTDRAPDAYAAGGWQAATLAEHAIKALQTKWTPDEDVPPGFEEVLHLGARRPLDPNWTTRRIGEWAFGVPFPDRASDAVEESKAVLRSLASTLPGPENHAQVILDELERLKALTKDLGHERDGAYTERNRLVAVLTAFAASKGWYAGLGDHEGADWDPEWRTVVYIDTPAGQVSFHLHDRDAVLFTHLGKYPGKWDGHTTEEKYQRLAEISEGLLSDVAVSR